MDKIDTIVKALKIICDNNDMKNVSSDMILDCAVRIYNTTKMNGKNETEGATDKQKHTMKNLHIDFKPDISKKEASELIGKKIDSFS